MVISLAMVGKVDNPSPNTTTIQYNAYARAENKSFTHLVRDEIIEDLVDTRYIGYDGRDEWRVIAQSLTAALKSERRDNASHVNSGSERPK